MRLHQMFALAILLLAVSAAEAADFRKLPSQIRSIYGNFHAKDDLSALDADSLAPMSEAGFNVVDLKIHNLSRSRIAELAQAVNRRGMVLTLYTYFGTAPRNGVVTRDGKWDKSKIDFLDPAVWHAGFRSAFDLAEYSREIAIAAVKLDLETLALEEFIIPYSGKAWDEFCRQNQLDGNTAPERRYPLLQEKN